MEDGFTDGVLVTRIWRHATSPIALVEYDETKDGNTESKLANDHDRPPTDSFMRAMDALGRFIAAPYMVATPNQNKVRAREVRLWHPHEERMSVKMYGQIEPEGYDGDRVSLRTPKEQPSGDHLRAINLLVKHAIAYVNGERGQELLDLKSPDNDDEDLDDEDLDGDGVDHDPHANDPDALPGVGGQVIGEQDTAASPPS